jgi:hypothetical protein
MKAATPFRQAPWRPRLPATTTTTTTTALVCRFDADKPSSRSTREPTNRRAVGRAGPLCFLLEKSTSVAPSKRLEFFVAPPGTTRPNVDRALVEVDASSIGTRSTSVHSTINRKTSDRYCRYVQVRRTGSPCAAAFDSSFLSCSPVSPADSGAAAIVPTETSVFESR